MRRCNMHTTLLLALVAVVLAPEFLLVLIHVFILYMHTLGYTVLWYQLDCG